MQKLICKLPKCLANCKLQMANSNIVFLFQMTILRWVTFLLGSLTVTNTILLFWISFFLSFGNSDHLVSVSIDFPSNSELDHPFHFIAFGYSLADWNDLCDRLRDIQLIIWYDLKPLGGSKVILPRSIRWVPGIFGNLVVKSKLEVALA